jgi:hypothetical protein
VSDETIRERAIEICNRFWNCQSSEYVVYLRHLSAAMRAVRDETLRECREALDKIPLSYARGEKP